MDILYLLDRLENLIASSRRMPLVNQIIVKEGDILSIIDEMRTVIPDEIKQARRVLQEKERILAQANAEAANVVSRARAESERAMNREGLLRSAEERSKDLVQQAQQHTENLKSDADSYVSETLHNLREHLMNIETDMSRTILSIERGLESIAEQGQEQESEEDVIQPQESTVGEEEYEADEEVDTEPTTGMQPRRASLANDTIGGPIFP